MIDRWDVLPGFDFVLVFFKSKRNRERESETISWNGPQICEHLWLFERVSWAFWAVSVPFIYLFFCSSIMASHNSSGLTMHTLLHASFHECLLASSSWELHYNHRSNSNLLTLTPNSPREQHTLIFRIFQIFFSYIKMCTYHFLDCSVCKMKSPFLPLSLWKSFVVYNLVCRTENWL